MKLLINRKRNFAIKLSLLILVIIIPSVAQWTTLPIGNTYVWWFTYALCLIFFVKGKKLFFDISNNRNLTLLYLYLAWNILCIIRGLFVADNYWEFKNLVSTTMFLLLPLSIFTFTHKEIVQKVITIWFKFALPLFLLFYFYLESTAYGIYLFPISFLMLFFPILTKKWKLIIGLLTLFVLFVDISARSNVIKFLLPVFFVCLYFFRNKSIKFIKTSRLFLLYSPIVFFILGVFYSFNIFKMDEYINDDFNVSKSVNGELSNESLKTDTRSLLYTEVLDSALKNEYIIFGRTPARGNDSYTFGDILSFTLNTNKNERFSNEVSILNIFTWTGLIGVISYFLVFLRCSYLAVNRSNNIYIKIIGLYIAFRWSSAWVEDFSRFNISNIFLWLIIGMCFSKSFRVMNNNEMKYWVRGIFDKRYR